MKLSSESFKDGDRIPDRFAFCNPATEGHVSLAQTAIRISRGRTCRAVPDRSRSSAMIRRSQSRRRRKPGRTKCSGELAESRLLPLGPLQPAHDTAPIGEGEFSDGVTRGANQVRPRREARRGINDFTGWFAADEQMSGDYYGYDGPCPHGTTRSSIVTCSRSTHSTSPRSMSRDAQRPIAARGDCRTHPRPGLDHRDLFAEPGGKGLSCLQGSSDHREPNGSARVCGQPPRHFAQSRLPVPRQSIAKTRQALAADERQRPGSEGFTHMQPVLAHELPRQRSLEIRNALQRHGIDMPAIGDVRTSGG